VKKNKLTAALIHLFRTKSAPAAQMLTSLPIIWQTTKREDRLNEIFYYIIMVNV